MFVILKITTLFCNVLMTQAHLTSQKTDDMTQTLDYSVSYLNANYLFKVAGDNGDGKKLNKLIRAGYKIAICDDITGRMKSDE